MNQATARSPGGGVFMRVNKKLIREFQEWLLLDLAEDTAKSYGMTLRTYCLRKDVVQINNKEFFVKLAEKIKESGYSLGTISRHVFAVKKFLLFLNEKYELPIFDLQRVRCKRAPIKRIIYLEKEEIQAIRSVPVENLYQLRDRTLFEFLMDTGCRISEAVGVEWKEIDPFKGELEIIGKGNKQRVVFVRSSQKWISEYLKKRPQQSPHLFLSQQSNRWGRSDACCAIRRLGERAGLVKRISPHTIRKTFCTYLVWAGADIKTVMVMMGHSDIATTLKYYVAANYNKMKEIHIRLEKMTGVGV